MIEFEATEDLVCVGATDVAQLFSVCLPCTKPWDWFPALNEITRPGNVYAVIPVLLTWRQGGSEAGGQHEARAQNGNQNKKESIRVNATLEEPWSRVQ